MKQSVRDGVIPNESDLSMSSSKRALTKAGLCLALAGMLAGGARAEDSSYLKVSLDHARILKLDRPVSKVIIGNDQIADATVADTRTIVLTGRKFGTTNLVLLDAQGNAIVDEKLLVTLDEVDTIRVYRQTDRKVLFCATSCEPMNTDGSGGGASTAAAATPG